MNWAAFWILLPDSLVEVPSIYFCFSKIWNVKMTLRGLAITWAAYYLPSVVRFLFAQRMSGEAMLLLTLNFYGMIRWAMNIRGWRSLILTVSSLVIMLILDTLCGIVGAAILNLSFVQYVIGEQIDAARWFLIFFCCIVLVGVGSLFQAIRHRGAWRKRIHPVWVHIARPILLALVVVLTFTVYERRLLDLEHAGTVQEIVLNIILCCVLLLVSVSYFIQDMRYLSLLRENATWEQQRQTSELLLSELRTFRHNIANMIYGFEGAIISGDMQEINSYYHEFAKRCARVNNENVYGVRRIPNAPVVALMMRKLERAQEMNIPFFLNVQEELHWRNHSGPLLCEVLGVLIDNALEAAAASNTPYVGINITDGADGMEIDIRNTVEGQPVYPFPAASSKPGHSGLGIKSVEKQLADQRSIFFNQFAQGRYIHSVIVIQ